MTWFSAIRRENSSCVGKRTDPAMWMLSLISSLFPDLFRSLPRPRSWHLPREEPKIQSRLHCVGRHPVTEARLPECFALGIPQRRLHLGSAGNVFSATSPVSQREA